MQVIDELATAAGDDLIPKYRWSAFFQTYLDLALRARHIDTLIIAGGSTDVGCQYCIRRAQPGLQLGDCERCLFASRER